jgi:hypothetical protein
MVVFIETKGTQITKRPHKEKITTINAQKLFFSVFFSSFFSLFHFDFVCLMDTQTQLPPLLKEEQGKVKMFHYKPPLVTIF